MKFTLSWLAEYFDHSNVLNVKLITELLEKIGLECENVKDWPSTLSPFIVAEVLEAEKHPNADSLQVCKVYDGYATHQVVCGAPNARKGIKVIMSPIGVTIPGNGMVIQEVMIRGVKSCGMLCSAKELGISNDHARIVELPDSALVGVNPAPWIMDEVMLDVSITPNMGRVMSIMGMAREVAAFGNLPFMAKSAPALLCTHKSPIDLKIDCLDACRFISGMHIKNINNKVSLPDLIARRLCAVGISSVSPVVDIVNYCFHEIGQPMHAYDANKITGGCLRVERMGNQIDFMALDGCKYSISAGTVVVADSEGATCLAGVMGDKRTACTEDTIEIFLEAALFNQESVHGTPIRTQSRARFERGVDDAFCLYALEFTAAMIIEICGGNASEIVSYGSRNLHNKTISLGVEYMARIAGRNFSVAEIESGLNRLGIVTETGNGIIECKLPTWMHDLQTQADIVEESLKIIGYDYIVPTSFVAPAVKQKLPNDEIRSALAMAGYCDTMTWSFISKAEAEQFANNVIVLKNPISDSMCVMRPSILPGMLSAVARNISRGVVNMAISEVGPVYTSPHDRCMMATAIRVGHSCERNIFESPRPVDVFDIKADFYMLLKYMSPGIDLGLVALDITSPDYYHPAQSACVMYDGSLIGYIGALHPKLKSAFDVKLSAVVMELYCDALHDLLNMAHKKKSLHFSKFPRVCRDFAFVVNDDIKAQHVIDAIKAINIDIIKEINVFDVYKNEKIGEGKYSIAFTVIAQSDERTLREEEISVMSEKIIVAISSQLGGVIRLDFV